MTIMEPAKNPERPQQEPQKDQQKGRPTCVAAAARPKGARTRKETPPSPSARQSEGAPHPAPKEGNKEPQRHTAPPPTSDSHAPATERMVAKAARARAQPPEGGRARQPKGAGAKRHGKSPGRAPRGQASEANKETPKAPLLSAAAQPNLDRDAGASALAQRAKAQRSKPKPSKRRSERQP